LPFTLSSANSRHPGQPIPFQFHPNRLVCSAVHDKENIFPSFDASRHSSLHSLKSNGEMKEKVGEELGPAGWKIDEILGKNWE
jgi:hypothetical protein